MASEKKSNAPGKGISFFGVLGIVFIVLKLTGHIDWSWWWVLAPFWGGFAAIIVLLLVIGGGVLGVATVQHMLEQRRINQKAKRR